MEGLLARVDVRRVSEGNVEDKGEAAESLCLSQEVGGEFKLVDIRRPTQGASMRISGGCEVASDFSREFGNSQPPGSVVDGGGRGGEATSPVGERVDVW